MSVNPIQAVPARQYKGMRYVPIFDGDWDITKDYDPLVIVSYQGNSYTSRTFVPHDTAITDETYWALTGNYNAQVEAYRQEVADLSDNVDLLKFTVTPEMYGAIGNGIVDDTQALSDALNSGFNVLLKKGSKYLISSKIVMNTSNVVIFGNEAEITTNIDTGFINIHYESHDIKFINVNFNGRVTGTTTVSLVSTMKSEEVESPTYGQSVNNLSFENCTFVGGGFQLGLYSASNVTVTNCIFGDCSHADADFGGYCILIQSAYNIKITNCIFENQIHVRHKIYVSVDPERSGQSDIENDNVIIENCIFDDTNQIYQSSNTSAIAVRYTQNLKIHNNLFKHCVGISINSENGDSWVVIENNTFIDTVYRTAPTETRNTINLIQYAEHVIHAVIRNNHELSGSNSGLFILTGSNGEGIIEGNFTKTEKAIQVQGNFICDNNGTTGISLYHLRHSTFTGRFGENYSKGAGNIVVFTVDGIQMALKCVPVSWNIFQIDYTNNAIIPAVKRYGFTTTKNGENDYTIKLPWCSDESCKVVPLNIDGNFFIKVVSMSQNNGLSVRIKFVNFDGTDYTAQSTASIQLLPI